MVNITNNHGGNDVWVIKVNNEGLLISQNCFGGSGNETPNSISKIESGGYVVAAGTNSTNGDIKTYFGGNDLWVFKFDDLLSLQWSSSFGGSNTEVYGKAKAIETSEGDIVCGTETNSTNYSITAAFGLYDIWVLKLNSAGILKWQKSIGSNGTETFADMQISSDGTIYVLGSYKKLYADYTDLFVAGLSADGVVSYQKIFGGFTDDKPWRLLTTKSDEIIVEAVVNTGGNDVTGYHGNSMGGDIWVFKVSQTGNIVWQRCLGGIGFDGLDGGSLKGDARVVGAGAIGDIIATTDDGFLVTGFTEVNNNGDVEGYHNPSPLDSSRADIWIVKLDMNGQFQWQKCLGGFSGDWPRGKAIEIGKNEFIITGETISKDGDITNNKGLHDVWLIRIGAVNTVVAKTFIDQNANGLKESDEPFMDGVMVSASKDTAIFSTLTKNGFTTLEVDTGAYRFTAKPNLPYYNVLPEVYNLSKTTYNNVDTVVFAFQPVAGKRDLAISLVPLSPARPGFETQYKIFYQNVGTETIVSGYVELVKNSNLTIVSASPAYSTITGHTIRWNFSNLNPLDTASITIRFSLAAPPVVNFGDTIKSIATIYPVADDLTPNDNTSTLNQRVVGSYDPNDKTESHGGVLKPEQVTNGEYLTYTIRFQNTGNDTAFNVSIRDTLSSKLDWNTLEMITASHSYQLNIKNANQCTWNFNNIRLVDSIKNEPASHGYLVYRIKPKPTVAPGDTVFNLASIYFDYNLPVATNKERTTVANIVLPVKLLTFAANRVGKNNVIDWTTTQQINFSHFEVERSLNGRDFSSIGKVVASNSSKYSLTDHEPIKAINYYRLKMVDKDGRFEYSTVRTINNSRSFYVNIYPNPAKENLNIKIESDKKETFYLEIIGLDGKVLISRQAAVSSATLVNINIKGLASGPYFLRVKSADKQQTALRFEKL